MPHGCVDMRERLPTHPTKVYDSRSMGDVVYIAVHHSGPAPLDMTAEQAAIATARYHVEHNGWPGCGYHVIIVPDGSWAYCNDLTTMTYHIGPFNRQAVGICLWGDYREARVPDAMVDSIEEICGWIYHEKTAWALETGARYGLPAILGHGQLVATSCPGAEGLRAVAEVRRRLT